MRRTGTFFNPSIYTNTKGSVQFLYRALYVCKIALGCFYCLAGTILSCSNCFSSAEKVKGFLSPFFLSLT